MRNLDLTPAYSGTDRWGQPFLTVRNVGATVCDADSAAKVANALIGVYEEATEAYPRLRSFAEQREGHARSFQHLLVHKAVRV